MIGSRYELALLNRITTVPGVFGGKPVIRGTRLAVEHVLGMLAVGDDMDTILSGYPWLEREDIRACMVFGERIRSIEEFVHASEWRQDVEVGDSSVDDTTVYKHDALAIAATDDDAVAEEWVQDAEPDYDSEEDTGLSRDLLILRVAGYA